MPVAVHRVEVELRRVDNEVMVQVVGVRHRLQKAAPLIERNLGLPAVPHTRPRLCFQRRELSNRREARRRKRHAWTVDDARWFFESAWHAGEALYAAFVLILVLGLRKGEVLGLTWELVDLDAAE